MKSLVIQNPRFNLISVRAFSLLEVMIAMVIFAIGMLGLAGMQVIALENSFESSSRNQAIFLAYSMSERILANRKGQNVYLLSSSEKISVSKNCVARNCNFSEIVAFDQSQWQKNLSQQLLSGSGQVTGEFPDYTITVRWDENRNGATGTNCPPLNVNDKRCFQLQVKL